MSISIVAKASFGSCFSRLDAEYVEQSSLEAEDALTKKFSGDKLVTLVHEAKSLDKRVEASFTHNPRPIRYIAIDSVDNADGLAFETGYETVEDLPSRAQYLVRQHDVLVSNVRPNRGAIAQMRADQAGFVASSGFTIVRLRDDAVISPDYLFALLKTPTMRDQLVRRGRGSMYPAVVRDDVLDLFIPHVPSVIDAKVVAFLEQARDRQREFFSLKAQTKMWMEDLLAPIGSPPSPLDTRRLGVDWTEVDANMVFRQPGPLRLDAEFFRSEYEEFDARCEAHQASFRLGEFFELAPGRALSPSTGTSYYAKQGILTNVGINWSGIEEAEGGLAKSAWRLQVNDILLACTAHEIAYVGRRCDVVTAIPDWIGEEVGCVPDLMIVRPRASRPADLSLHYVAAFLRHRAGLHQVQRCIRGLRGGHVYKDDLERFVRIPLPDVEWLKTFDAIEAKAEVTRVAAKQLVQQAIDIVESFLIAPSI